MKFEIEIPKMQKDEFYEDVIFKEGKEHVKKFMSNWTSKLKRYKEIGKQITIKKFKNLLIPIREIILPIEIDYAYSTGSSLDINFTDNKGKRYYIIITLYSYDKLNTYIIGRRNSKIEPLIDREFILQITTERINLIETGLLKLKEDGTNSDEIVMK